jgi:hypothetical protein
VGGTAPGDLPQLPGGGITVTVSQDSFLAGGITVQSIPGGFMGRATSVVLTTDTFGGPHDTVRGGDA